MGRITQTDLGHNSRLLLNKELANDLVVPVLGAEAAKEKGVKVKVWDIDTNSLHSLVFKIRPSNQSPVFKETWIKDFVLRRGLKKADEIGMHCTSNGSISRFFVPIAIKFQTSISLGPL